MVVKEEDQKIRIDKYLSEKLDLSRSKIAKLIDEEIKRQNNAFNKLDEIFNEYYNDEDKCKRLVKTLVKFNIDTDRNTKKVIIDLCKQLDKLPLEKKEELVNNYEEKFLSDEYFNKVINDLVTSSKNIIIDTIKEAYFVEKNHAVLDSDNPELIANLFNDKSAFNVDINLCNFICSVNQDYYQKLKELFSLL